MSETVTCTVCGIEIGKGPGGLGLAQHGKMHRRQFVAAFGRWPDGYQEVRDKLNPAKQFPKRNDRQATIYEAALDEEQTTLGD